MGCCNSSESKPHQQRLGVSHNENKPEPQNQDKNDSATTTIMLATTTTTTTTTTIAVANADEINSNNNNTGGSNTENNILLTSASAGNGFMMEQCPVLAPGLIHSPLQPPPPPPQDDEQQQQAQQQKQQTETNDVSQNENKDGYDTNLPNDKNTPRRGKRPSTVRFSDKSASNKASTSSSTLSPLTPDRQPNKGSRSAFEQQEECGEKDEEDNIFNLPSQLAAAASSSSSSTHRPRASQAERLLRFELAMRQSRRLIPGGAVANAARNQLLPSEIVEGSSGDAEQHFLRNKDDSLTSNSHPNNNDPHRLDFSSRYGRHRGSASSAFGGLGPPSVTSTQAEPLDSPRVLGTSGGTVLAGSSKVGGGVRSDSYRVGSCGDDEDDDDIKS